MLSQNGKKMWIGLDCSQDAVFTQMDAIPLPTSPVVNTQAKNPGVRKLCINIKDVKSATISVTMAPLENGSIEEAVSVPVKPLARWEVLD